VPRPSHSSFDHPTNIWQWRQTLNAPSLNIYYSESLQPHTDIPCRPLTVNTSLCVFNEHVSQNCILMECDGVSVVYT